MKIPKHIEYAVLIQEVLSQLLNEQSDCYIDDLDDNLTEFFHALATVAPTFLFNRITNSDKNYLEFNHIANQLVFQYTNLVDEEEVDAPDN